jgi:SAM-dependent methyltransferase
VIFFPQRSNDPELMDNRSGDTALLMKTFSHFKPINLLFGRSRYFIYRMLLPHMERQQRRLFTIVDAGAGGGDFALLLARALERHSIAANIICIDSDPRAVAYAAQQCREVKNISVVRESALNLAKLPSPPDYLFASNLLHHLSEEACVKLLRTVNDQARCGYVIADLQRSAFWYCLYALFAGVFFRNSYALSDGLLSIRRGFTESELASIIELAGISPGLRIRRLLPGRLVVDTLQ